MNTFSTREQQHQEFASTLLGASNDESSRTTTANAHDDSSNDGDVMTMMKISPSPILAGTGWMDFPIVRESLHDGIENGTTRMTLRNSSEDSLTTATTTTTATDTLKTHPSTQMSRGADDMAALG